MTKYKNIFPEISLSDSHLKGVAPSTWIERETMLRVVAEVTPLNGGSSLTGGAGAGSAAEMKRGEWHPIIIRATNESNGHVTSLGHRIVVSLSLLVTASSSSSSTSSSDGVGTSFTPIGGQSLVALAETIPASSEENHHQQQQQQQQQQQRKGHPSFVVTNRRRKRRSGDPG